MTDATMRRLLNAMQIMQKEHERMSVGQAAVFVAVAADEGKSMTEYSRLVEVPEATMSRTLLDLGPRHRDKSPGFGLLTRENDEQDLRRFVYKLSPTGRGLRTRLYNVMQA